VSRKVKQEIISTEFFPTLLVGVTRSVLERDQTISGITADDWAGVFSTAYEETSRARVLEVSGTVGVEDRSWYEHMTAFTPNPDFELFELLGKCSDRSRPWIRRMVKLYSSDRMPLNSLKMTKYFLRIPETYEAYVAKVFETFFDEEFEKRKDSQARIVHIFMKKPIGPGTYIPHFVNIIGFLEKKLNVELAEIFVQNLTTTGWGYVEAQIRESKGHGHPFELTSSQLNCLFQQGLQEAQPVSDV
jgi:hypothetical protein